MGFHKSTLTKLALFNAALIVGNVVVFSRALLNVRISSGNALEAAGGITVLVLSAVLFFYVNLRILNAPPKKIDPKAAAQSLNTLEGCREAIARMGYSGTFSARMEQIAEQIQKMLKKKELIQDILLQKFSDREMSYQKFKATVDGAENVMLLNIRSILNRIYAFDEEEYEELSRGKSRLSKSIADQKIAIYREYIDFVDKAVDDDEEILLKLDKLLLEISKFNSIGAGELENMEAMKELDGLISDTKWYRQG